MQANDVQIHTDSNNIIYVKMIGFWTFETLNRYAKERSLAIKTLLHKGLPSNQIGIILDADDFQIQSKEIADGLSNVPTGPDDKDIHVAIIMDNALLQMQAKRLAPNRYHFFDNHDDALQWILDACKGND